MKKIFVFLFVLLILTPQLQSWYLHLQKGFPLGGKSNNMSHPQTFLTILFIAIEKIV